MLDPAKLVQPDTGVEYLLEALSAWEETSELKTFELFEKALYKVTQRPDEASHSYALRMSTAFADLGDKVSIKDMQAFVLLRQSAMTNEDKKRILTMAGGSMDLKKIEQSMRALSTKVLFSAGEPKKKVYPTNFVEPDDAKNTATEEDNHVQSTYFVHAEEEDILTAEHIDHLASLGDEDALTVQQFESDFESMLQDVPDLQQALITYQEARVRINEKKRVRGFWPNKGKGKSTFRGGRKGGVRSGKEELLAKISRTHCKLCGERGHWKAECPKRDGAREQANLVQSENDPTQPHELPQVIFEPLPEDPWIPYESCFHVHSSLPFPKGCIRPHEPLPEDPWIPYESCFHVHSSLPFPKGCIRPHVQKAAWEFWSHRIHKYKNNGAKEDKKGMNQQPATLHRMPPTKPVRRPSDLPEPSLCKNPVAECLTSQAHRANLQATGLAILDTGASRSVIGNDHVPFVLQKLPASVREQVRECPSKVGFRFGNNQIAYSFKQLQIPLMHQKQRIWLLIEVVPKATPFLLSIKTMKSLGANIDLSQNTCYLKTLNRSLPLKENSNGLFVIDMADLCSEKPTEAVFVASSAPISKPPGLFPEVPAADNADSPRSLGGTASAVRGGPRMPEDPLCDAVQHDPSCPARRSCDRARSSTNSAADQRSPCPEEQDLPTGDNHTEPVLESSESIQGTCDALEPNSVGGNWIGPVGTRRNGRRSPKPWSVSSRRFTDWSKPRFFPTFGICEHDEHASGSGHQEGSDQDCRDPHAQVLHQCRHNRPQGQATISSKSL